MYYVYYLQSTKFSNQVYKGFTNNLRLRVFKHTRGEVPHTSKYKPYKLILYIGFLCEGDFKRFETYLKSGYGRRFLKSSIRSYVNSST